MEKGFVLYNLLFYSLDGVDHVLLVVPADIVGVLVDHVHQDCGQVGGQENNVELLSSSRMGEIFL